MVANSLRSLRFFTRCFIWFDFYACEFPFAALFRLPFLPYSLLVAVVVVVVAVADRTKQGNTPNDDNDVVIVVIAVLFFVYFCVASLFSFCFAHCLRCVCVACVATCSDIWNAILSPTPLNITPSCPHPCAPIAKLLIRLPRFLAARQVGAKLVNGRSRRRRESISPRQLQLATLCVFVCGSIVSIVLSITVPSIVSLLISSSISFTPFMNILFSLPLILNNVILFYIYKSFQTIV